MDADDRHRVGIFKATHRGSDRAVSEEFLEEVSAEHDIISDGCTHQNPDHKTLKRISNAIARRNDFKMHLANTLEKFDQKKQLNEFKQTDIDAGRTGSVFMTCRNSL